MAIPSITLPGIGGSGPDHWQSRWEVRNRSARRFRPSDWDHPDLADWLGALDRAVAEAGKPAILVAHSLACLLVLHWAERTKRPVRGAFLVALPDPDENVFPREAASFRDPPAKRLSFPTLIVASADDPYGSVDHAQTKAATLGAGLVVAGSLGHINGASGLGDWPQGEALLEAFRAGTGGGR